MSDPRRRAPGPDDYLTFLHASPKLALAFGVGVVCTIGGLIIGVATNSPEVGLVGGSLVILGVALLVDVAVRFYQWQRAEHD